METENCNPVAGEEATSGVVVVGLLVYCKGEAGVSAGESALEGIFEGGEIGQRKVAIGLERRSEPESVKDWKPSGSKRTERQSSQGGMDECTAA